MRIYYTSFYLHHILYHLHNPFKLDVIIPIVQGRKVRLREVNDKLEWDVELTWIQHSCTSSSTVSNGNWYENSHSENSNLSAWHMNGNTETSQAQNALDSRWCLILKSPNGNILWASELNSKKVSTLGSCQGIKGDFNKNRVGQNKMGKMTIEGERVMKGKQTFQSNLPRCPELLVILVIRGVPTRRTSRILDDQLPSHRAHIHPRNPAIRHSILGNRYFKK